MMMMMPGMGMQPGVGPMMMMSGAGPMMMMPGMNMGMNPMMMMPGMGMQGEMRPAMPPPGPAQASTDPRVRQLCRHFGIDDKTCSKLNAAMQTREDFDEDMQALWEVMEKAQNAGRKPLDVMLVKIREIERGQFAGKDLLDKDIQAFVSKYELDDRVINRLIQTMNMRKEKKKQDLIDMDQRLESAKRPAGLLVRLLEGLQDHGRLPSPPRFLGLTPPTYREKADSGDFARARRSRSRSRDRRR